MLDFQVELGQFINQCPNLGLTCFWVIICAGVAWSDSTVTLLPSKSAST